MSMSLAAFLCMFIYLFAGVKDTGGDDGCHFNATISVRFTSILHFFFIAARYRRGQRESSPSELLLCRGPA